MGRYMKKNKMFLLILPLTLLIEFCNQNDTLAEYELSHAKRDSLSEEFSATAPKTLILKNDSITVFDFEPYLSAKKGIIKDNYIYFDNDTIYYEFSRKFLITFEDSLLYYWQKK